MWHVRRQARCPFSAMAHWLVRMDLVGLGDCDAPGDAESNPAREWMQAELNLGRLVRVIRGRGRRRWLDARLDGEKLGARAQLAAVAPLWRGMPSVVSSILCAGVWYAKAGCTAGIL